MQGDGLVPSFGGSTSGGSGVRWTDPHRVLCAGSARRPDGPPGRLCRSKERLFKMEHIAARPSQAISPPIGKLLGAAVRRAIPTAQAEGVRWRPANMPDAASAVVTGL